MKLFRKLTQILAVGASALILTQGAAFSVSADTVPTGTTTSRVMTTTSTTTTTTTTAALTVTTANGRAIPATTAAHVSNANASRSAVSEDYLTFLDDSEPMKKYYDEIASHKEVYDADTDMAAFFAEAQYKFHDAFGTALTDYIGKGVMITILIVLILLSLLWGCTGHKSYPFFSSLLLFLLMNGLSAAELICAATGADTKFFTAVPIWLNTAVFVLSAGLIFFCFKRRRFSAFIMMMTCTFPPVLLGSWFILRERYVNAYSVWLGYRQTLLSDAEPIDAGATLTVLTIILFAFSIGIAAIISLLGARFRKPFLMIASSLSCGAFAGYLLGSLITGSSKLSVLTYLAMGLLILGCFLVQLYIGHGFLEKKKKQPAPSPVGGQDMMLNVPDGQPEPMPFPAPSFPQVDFPQPVPAPQFGEEIPQYEADTPPYEPVIPQTEPEIPQTEPEFPQTEPVIPQPAVPQASFCTNCGAKLDPDALFCTSCGFRIGADAPQEPDSEPAPQDSDALRNVFTDPFTGEAEKPAPEPEIPAAPAERPASNQESRRNRENTNQQHSADNQDTPALRMGGIRKEETGLKLHFDKKEQKTSTGDDVFDKDEF